MSETTSPPEALQVRVTRLIAHWRAQGDVCAEAGRITAATQYRNFADALEEAVAIRQDQLLMVTVAMHTGLPRLEVTGTGKGALAPEHVADVLRQALQIVEAQNRLESTADALASALG